MDDGTVLYDIEFKADVYEIKVDDVYDCRIISSSTFGVYAIDPNAPDKTGSSRGAGGHDREDLVSPRGASLGDATMVPSA